MKNPYQLQAFSKSSLMPHLLLLVVLGELSPSSAGWKECVTGGTAALQIFRHQGESSPARKEVYWAGEHSSRECLLGARPKDLAFCLLGGFHLSQETSYQMGAAFRHPSLVSPEA